MREVTAIWKVEKPNGQEDFVVEMTEVRDAGHSADPHATIYGMQSLELRTGEKVRRLEAGGFQTVGTGEILKVISSPP